MPTTDAEKRKEHNQRYYHESGGKEKIVARNRINRAAKAKYVTDIKSAGSCTDCGNQFHPAAMDFDHVGTDKVAPVSQLVANNVSYKRIDAEIAKCELVCANCHRVRTHERFLASLA